MSKLAHYMQTGGWCIRSDSRRANAPSSSPPPRQSDIFRDMRQFIDRLSPTTGETDRGAQSVMEVNIESPLLLSVIINYRQGHGCLYKRRPMAKEAFCDFTAYRFLVWALGGIIRSGDTPGLISGKAPAPSGSAAGNGPFCRRTSAQADDG